MRGEIKKTEPSAMRAGSPKTIWSHFNPLYHFFTVNQDRLFSSGFGFILGAHACV